MVREFNGEKIDQENERERKETDEKRDINGKGITMKISKEREGVRLIK